MDLDDETAAALGRAWVDDRPWSFLTDLTAIGNRMAGSEGEARAAELTADALRDAGARGVREEPFGMIRWERGDAELHLTRPDERSFRAIALPYSPSGEAVGELVDVGHGTPSEVDDVDVAGKVAIASTTTPSGGRFVHRMEKFGHAVDAGAVGFVFRNHVPGQLPPTGALRFGEEAAAPAVGVSRETGEWLTEYADRGGAVRLSVEADTRPGESRNVVGRLGPAPAWEDSGHESGVDAEDTENGGDAGDAGDGGGDAGPTPADPESDGEILLLAHVDAHDVAEGALDNGCGVAVVVTAARILDAMGDDLVAPVRVAGVGGEEVGLLGSERLSADADLDRVKAVVNVDGAGRHRDLVALTHTSGATAAAARRVAERTRQPIEVDGDPHPFSDQWPFVRRGVPALQLHSDSGERGRGWGHTRADTRDKVDDRIVREHAMLTALLVAELAESEVPRLDADALATAFHDADFEAGMRAAGLWPAAWE